MKIEIHHHHHIDDALTSLVLSKLDLIIKKLDAGFKIEPPLAKQLEDLKQELKSGTDALAESERKAV